MRAVRFHAHGGFDRLVVDEVPEPEPGEGEVVVRVVAVGVSPLDDKVRAGVLPDSMLKELPLVPGATAVGEVVDAGASSWATGDRVLITGWGFGTTRDGLWRERVAVAADSLVALPDGVDDHTAAAMAAGSGYLTAYLSLTELAPVRPGARLLSPGYAGAVAMATVDLARVLGAGTVISTARGEERATRARESGLAHIIDPSTEDLRDEVRRLTDGHGLDVVVDGVGGPLTGDLVASLAPRGTLVAVGYTAGTTATFEITHLIWKTAQIKGFLFTLFSPERIRAANERLLELVAGKQIAPMVAEVFPLERAAEAQRHVVEDQPFGRVLLAP